MRTILVFGIFLSLVILSCHSKKLHGNKYKRELCNLIISKDTINAFTSGVLCTYLCKDDNPSIIDDGYTEKINIVFHSTPVVGKTYELPNNDITVTGTFTSVWIWDKVYENHKINGTIKVVQFRNQSSLKLNINLFELFMQNNEKQYEKLLNGRYTFRS